MARMEGTEAIGIRPPRIVYLTGPTGSGKTELSLRLAEVWDAEIINCDSLQIYRGLDIGTAKATPGERARVQHHLLDIREPDEEFSVADFLAAAEPVLEGLEAQGRSALVVGGTLQYMQSLRRGNQYLSPPADPEVRARLNTEAERLGKDALYQRLEALDPQRARELHPNDQLRVVRALEIIELSGRKASDFVIDRERKGRWWGPIIALIPERQYLYERINARVDAMIEQGLLEEARKFYETDPPRRQGAAKAIGYKELFPYFEGEETLEEAVATLKRETRRYAKRQLTALRSLETPFRYEIGPNTGQKELFERILRYISANGD